MPSGSYSHWIPRVSKNTAHRASKRERNKYPLYSVCTALNSLITRHLLTTFVEPTDGQFSFLCDTDFVCHTIGHSAAEHPKFRAISKQHIIEMHGITAFLRVLITHKLRIKKV